MIDFKVGNYALIIFFEHTPHSFHCAVSPTTEGAIEKWQSTCTGKFVHKIQNEDKQNKNTTHETIMLHELDMLSYSMSDKGNNKITEHRAIFQRERQNS